MSAHDSNATMAVFLDLENIASAPATPITRGSTFKRLSSDSCSKGTSSSKRPTADFDRYQGNSSATCTRPLSNSSRFRTCACPARTRPISAWWWNALDLCYTKGHVDTFVIISGDSGFLAPGQQASRERQNRRRRRRQELHGGPVHQ